MKAPIVIFAFNRPRNLELMIESLKANEGIEGRKIIAFVDGPRTAGEEKLVNEVSQIAKCIADEVHVSAVNKGLARSVIDGVSYVLDTYERAIILEDDLVLHPQFLNYMDWGLQSFSQDERILSICGHGLKIRKPAHYAPDVYLGIRSSSWGWGTWRDRWEKVDWDVSTFPQLESSARLRRKFNRGGSDMFSMLAGYIDGKNNSWASRFCYHQFLHGMYSVHPFKSFVRNDGYGIAATNCRQKYNRFKIEMQDIDYKIITPPNLAETPLETDAGILRQLRRYHSIGTRLYSFVRRKLNI